jgi:hypothetical protein
VTTDENRYGDQQQSGKHRLDSRTESSRCGSHHHSGRSGLDKRLSKNTIACKPQLFGEFDLQLHCDYNQRSAPNKQGPGAIFLYKFNYGYN